MMTLHKLHAGDGYTYLTRQVAAGDEGRSPGQKLVDYYTSSGNPPGRWMGAGAADLAVEGMVREDQMRSLFGRGMHPDADQIVALETAAGHGEADARRAAKLGRAFPKYQQLPPRSERIAARVAAFEAEHGRPPSKAVRSAFEAPEARRDRRAVAGYDLVFTPVKSVSVLWALGSAAVRAQVEAAHHDAVADTLAWLERETAFARVGDRGEAQIETRGFLAASFDHRDSRAGDPDLHTHLAISNKVRARKDYPDGSARWLSLDARVLHAAAVAASERYNTRIEENLARRLGVEFTERPDSVRPDKRLIREISGVPGELLRHFSRRRAAIEDRYRDLASDYRARHGHEPSTQAQLQLAQQATLETRNGKPPPSTLADKIKDWRAQAATVVGRRTVERLGDTTTDRVPQHAAPGDLPVDELAATVLAVVSEEKSTWTKWNVTAEVERQLRSFRFASTADRDAATALVVDRALHPDRAVNLNPDAVALDVQRDEMAAFGVSPAALAVNQTRSDGSSVLTQHGSTRYTVQELLDAEQRLLDCATQPTRYGLDPRTTAELITDFEQRYDVALDPGQRGLVLGFAADPRRLVTGLGPAGTGKTTAMRAVAHAWHASGRRVVPLAPSATAAEVLGAELGCRAENLHKFQHAHQSNTALEDDWFVLQPGDLVIVDEAGMAGTRKLDWLTRYARERGALVRLLGDYAQMSPVEAGGALRLLVHTTGAYELSELHRFADPQEAAATLHLREGRTEALDFYFARHRVTHGSSEAMLEQSYEAWAADTRQGRTSLLIASSGRDVTALNARARLERVRTGEVSADGVALQDGNCAGVGDRVVTRTNDRRLTTSEGRDFVKNGDTWTVEELHRDGALTVRRLGHGGRVRLPAAYVAESLELGYASTPARSQGMTVDTTHVLVDSTTTRESLYVAATRGRLGATLFVGTERHIGIEAERPPAPTSEARDVLADALARLTSERSATEVRREAGGQSRERYQVGERLLRGHVVRFPSSARVPSMKRESKREGLPQSAAHPRARRQLDR